MKKRSTYALKYKPAFDAEAIVVDYRMGEGKYKGLSVTSVNN